MNQFNGKSLKSTVCGYLEGVLACHLDTFSDLNMPASRNCRWKEVSWLLQTSRTVIEAISANLQSSIFPNPKSSQLHISFRRFILWTVFHFDCKPSQSSQAAAASTIHHHKTLPSDIQPPYQSRPTSTIAVSNTLTPFPMFIWCFSKLSNISYGPPAMAQCRPESSH